MVSSYPTARPLKIVPLKIPQIFDRNLRRLPVNDPRPPKPPKGSSKALKVLGGVRGPAKIVLKRLPYIGIPLTLIELYELYRKQPEPERTEMNGFTFIRKCLTLGGGIVWHGNSTLCHRRVVWQPTWDQWLGRVGFTRHPSPDQAWVKSIIAFMYTNVA